MIDQSKKKVLALLSTFLLLVSAAFAAEEDDILGLWNTPEKDCKMEIYKCSDKYCGRIAWLKDPYYPDDDDGGMAGKPVVDRKNPNSDLRTRPLVGLQIMEGFTYTGKTVWEKGTIYSPRHGRTYKGKMALSAPHRLEVRGFIGIPLLGGTSVWTR